MTSGRAGGSGLNVVVVVNQASTNSVALANTYCELRGVPPQNVFRMRTWSGGRVSWTLQECEANLAVPLRQMLVERGLSNQARVVLLSMDIPYRVMSDTGQNSTTSVLFYGFKPDEDAPANGFPASCSLPAAARYDQALGELPFAEARPAGEGLGTPVMMLTDTALPLAEQALKRAVLADRTFPTNWVYLERTSDTARNVRYPDFDNAIFESSVLGRPAVRRLDSDATSFTGLLGMETGLYAFAVPTNAFVAGAIADTMTSFAGGLFENLGQTTLFEWLHAGAAASYGTVVEPCNYPAKFPQPMVYFYQGRGFSNIESYYMSVRYPYQGLFVGEPLSAPFAQRATGTWIGPAEGSVVQGVFPLATLFEAADTNRPLARLDLFMDGRFVRNLTNAGPSAGNQLTITIGDATYTHTVGADQTISSVVTELATNLNASMPDLVRAEAVGDRIILDQILAGPELPVSVSSSAGSASDKTTWISVARPQFLASPAMGVREVEVKNAPAIGDWMELEVLKTNGSRIRVAITNNDAQATAFTFAQTLTNSILTSPDLGGPDGLRPIGLNVPYGSTRAVFELYANSPGLEGSRIEIALAAHPNLSISPTGTTNLDGNIDDLYPRNHLYIGAGYSFLGGTFLVDSSEFPDGTHAVKLVASEGSSVETQAEQARTLSFQNTSLRATLVPSVTTRAIPLKQLWNLDVTANEANVATIELFSTGGLIGFVAGLSSASFPVPSSDLGTGLHPFYAVVQNALGQKYRTETLYVRLTGEIKLELAGPPWELSWIATPGVTYEVQKALDLRQDFEAIDTITATNTIGLWPLPDGTPPAYYRLRVVGD